MPGHRHLPLFAALLMLGGCASGVEPGGNFPSQSFDVPAPYKAAFRRAGEFVRVCHIAPEHRYGVRYGDKKTLDEKFATATIAVYKEGSPAVQLEVIQLKPKGNADSTATITVLGDGIWDAGEIAAARQSIQSATPVCRDTQD
jgi:hypothetical protein